MEHMAAMGENMVDVAWNMTVLDIEQTLRTSINKMFRDKGTDSGIKAKRALGLIKLAEIFEKYGDTTG